MSYYYILLSRSVIPSAAYDPFPYKPISQEEEEEEAAAAKQKAGIVMITTGSVCRYV